MSPNQEVVKEGFSGQLFFSFLFPHLAPLLEILTKDKIGSISDSKKNIPQVQTDDSLPLQRTY